MEHKLAKYIPQDRSTLEIHKLQGLFRDDYPQYFKHQWLRNKLMSEELLSWGSDLPSKAIILKGMHLIEDYYLHIGERFIGDIDLLIDSSFLKSWDRFLLKHGFFLIEEHSWEANQFKSLYKKTVAGGMEVVIEIHTQLFYQQALKEILLSLPSQQYPGFHKLTPEDLFVHLCGHLGYQHTFISYHWLFDVFIVLQKDYDHIDWFRVFLLSQSLCVERSCRVVLHLLERDYDIKIPQNFIKLSMSEIFLLKLLSRSFLISTSRKPLRYWFIKHLIKDRLSQAIKYDLLWLRRKL